MAVLCGVDGSVGSEAALEWAAREATDLGVRLHLVHAAVPDGQPAGRAVLERARRSVLRQHPGLPVSTTTSPARPEEALTDPGAGPEELDLIVVGRRGAGGFAQLALGSAAVAAATLGAAPVVIVPAGTAAAGEGILLAVDALAPDPAVLGLAFDRAQAWARPLRAVTAWETGVLTDADDIQHAWTQHEQPAVRALAAALLPWVAAYPDVSVEQLVRQGHPAGVVLELQDNADLVVIGRGSLARRLGPISGAVLQLARVPVVVVPPASATAELRSAR